MALIELPDDVKEAITEVIRYGINEEADDHSESCNWAADEEEGESRDPSDCDGSDCSHIYLTMGKVADWLESIGVKLWPHSE